MTRREIYSIFDEDRTAQEREQATSAMTEIIEGSCAGCAYATLCEHDEDYDFPPDAPCMVGSKG